MGEPTTVLGWLETLPTLGKFTQLANSTNQDTECHCWADLFQHLSRYSPDGITARRYWLGAFYYVTDAVVDASLFYVAVVHGFNDAKAAFEAHRLREQSPENVLGDSPEKVYAVTEIWEPSKIKAEQDAILRQALAKWGNESQMGMAIEEAAELQIEVLQSLSRYILALRKCLRVGGREVSHESREKAIDEIADNIVMGRQMAMIFGEDAVNERVAYKINRLKGRLGK